MREFLIKLVRFVLPPAVILLGVLLLTQSWVSSRNENLATDPSVHSLVLGDSHMQCAVNDSLYPGSRNAGLTSEVYAYALEKLKFLHGKYPQLKRVFLGVSYHSFSDYYDPFFSMEQFASRYYFSMPMSLQLEVLDMNDQPAQLLYRSMKEEWENRNAGLNEIHWLGGFRKVVTAVDIDEARIQKRIDLQYFDEQGLERGLSERQIAEFTRICAWCREQGLELVLIQAPLHPEYERRVPGKFKEAFRKVASECGAAFFDYSSLKFEGPDYLPDGDHLSPRGAVAFSEWLRGAFP